MECDRCGRPNATRRPHVLAQEAHNVFGRSSRKKNFGDALLLELGGDLVIADFQSNELRVVRDTDADGMSDSRELDAKSNPRSSSGSRSMASWCPRLERPVDSR